MSQKLELKSIKPLFAKRFRQLGRHTIFFALLATLFCYLIVVWRISQLATAEPTSEQVVGAKTAIPKVDKKAIEQIQQLEQNSPAVKSLFNSARSNPFQE